MKLQCVAAKVEPGSTFLMDDYVVFPALPAFAHCADGSIQMNKRAKVGQMWLDKTNLKSLFKYHLHRADPNDSHFQMWSG